MAKKRRSQGSKKGGLLAPIVFLTVVLALVGIVYFLRGGHIGVLDRTTALDERLAPVLGKYGLSDRDIIRHASEEKSLDGESYIRTYREYKASKNISLRSFESSLKSKLKSTEFRVVKSNIFSGREIESGVFFINRGKMDIMALRVTKTRGQAPPAAVTVKKEKAVEKPEPKAEPKQEPKPSIVKPEPKAEIRPPAPKPVPAAKPVPAPVLAPAARRAGGAKMAIVLDDFGYNMNNIAVLASIEQPVTMSILPNLRYSKEVERAAHARGREVMLHLPMQSQHAELKEEFNIIKPGLSKREILARLDYHIANFKNIKGVNNHQGSEATEDRMVMSVILQRLKEKGLYFLDSFTSAKSTCKQVASELGERFARRDVFLDNSDDPEYIKKQLLQAKKIALKKGYAIAIGHDRKNTVKVLSEMMPVLASEGIDFVYMSEIVD